MRSAAICCKQLFFIAQVQVLFSQCLGSLWIPSLVDLDRVCMSIPSCSIRDSVVLDQPCYYLNCEVRVYDGGVLTISAGTTLIATSLSSLDSPAMIVVLQGGKIVANGTADNPITFTAHGGYIPLHLQTLSATDSKVSSTAVPTIASYMDDPTRIVTNVVYAKTGLWGGIVIAGKAPIDHDSTMSMEGVTNVPFGGNEPTDSSGVLRYVRVWHSGFVVNSGNEVNGISLGGVGNGTVVEHVEVVLSSDDGIEFFGGNVNARWISVLNVGDDAIDIDLGYHGHLQNVFILRTSAETGSAFEVGGSGTTNSSYDFQIESSTVIDLADTQTSGHPLINIQQSAASLMKGTFSEGVVCSNASSFLYCPAGVDCGAVYKFTNFGQSDECNATSAKQDNDWPYIDPLVRIPPTKVVDNVSASSLSFVTGAFENESWLSSFSILNEFGRIPSNNTESIPCGTLNFNISLTNETIWLLKCCVMIDAGHTLHIEQGTTIVALMEPLSTTSACVPSIVISQGARIEASGTQANPITFKSALPNHLLPYRGAWGGLIIAGNAPITVNGVSGGTSQVEGFPNVLFGGSDITDDSGVLQHVRLWYGGRRVEHGVEINSLTLAGVGNDTTIAYIEAAYGADDGVEVFGGSVNLGHVAAVFCLDDAFDFDAGYVGNVQFAIALVDASGDHAIETDAGFTSDVQGAPTAVRTHPHLRSVTLVRVGSSTLRPLDTFVAVRTYSGLTLTNLIVSGAASSLIDFNSCDSTFPTTLNVSSNTIALTNVTYGFCGGLNESSFDWLTPTKPVLVKYTYGTGIQSFDLTPIADGPAFEQLDSASDDPFFVTTKYKGAFDADSETVPWLTHLTVLTGLAPVGTASYGNDGVIVGIVMGCCAAIIVLFSGFAARHAYFKTGLGPTEIQVEELSPSIREKTRHNKKILTEVSSDYEVLDPNFISEKISDDASSVV
eukprot:m.242683 g.242683  ORF g.242683 m.242683 type:complete len:949 (-) comp33803_c0_seq1:104-2950(-)